MIIICTYQTECVSSIFCFFLEEKLSCEAKILRRVFNIYIYLFKLEA